MSILSTKNMSKRMKKRNAFTLAEVLITLGIIGIVSALTIPTLITKYKIKQHEIAFKKADAMIQEALKKSLYEMGYADASELNISKMSYDAGDSVALNQTISELNEIFLKQFKGIKQLPSCFDLYFYKGIRQYYFFGEDPNGRCYNSETGHINSPYNTYLLPNGITISDVSLKTDSNSRTYYFAGIQVTFDTNGPYKGPNRIGHDIFTYVSNPRATDVMCNPTIQHSRSWMGCYFFAQKNQSPLNPSEPYWNLLYTPKSYWLNYKK